MGGRTRSARSSRRAPVGRGLFASDPDDVLRQLFQTFRLEVRFDKPSHLANCRVTIDGDSVARSGDRREAGYDIPPHQRPFHTWGVTTLSDPEADTMVLVFKGTPVSTPRGFAPRSGRPKGIQCLPILATSVVAGGGLGVFQNLSGVNVEDACASIGASVPAEGSPYGGLSAE